jgi:predicted ATPase
VLTGAPGAGKTALGQALASRGYVLVPEAATNVIALEQARGVDAPWERDDFLDEIVELQHRRQVEAVSGGASPHPEIVLFDRSPLCALALARWLDRPFTPVLAAEVARVVDQGIFESDVLFVEPLGFLVPSAARRIGYPDALRFGQVHEQVYLEHGFSLVRIPAAPVPERADLVEGHLRRAAS